jgi:hypothetical protein
MNTVLRKAILTEMKQTGKILAGVGEQFTAISLAVGGLATGAVLAPLVAAEALCNGNPWGCLAATGISALGFSGFLTSMALYRDGEKRSADGTADLPNAVDQQKGQRRRRVMFRKLEK